MTEQAETPWVSENRGLPAYSLIHIIASLLCALMLLIFIGSELLFYVSLTGIAFFFIWLSSGTSWPALLKFDELPSQVWRGFRAALIFNGILLFAPMGAILLFVYFGGVSSGTLGGVEKFVGLLRINLQNHLSFTALVVAATSEEIFFRGWIYPALRARVNFYGAVIGSSIIFTLIHPGNPYAIIAIFAGGAIMAVLVERTKRLVPAIVFHVLYNFFSLMLFGGV